MSRSGFLSNLITVVIIVGCLLLLSLDQQGLARDVPYLNEFLKNTKSSWDKHMNSTDINGDVQISLPGPISINKKHKDYDCTFKTQNRYILSGVVVGVRKYSVPADGPSSLDVCIVWGETAKPDYLEHFSVTMTERYCSYRYRWPEGHPTLSDSYISTHFSNNHLIFSSDEQEKASLNNIHRGDKIIIEGYLVDFHCKRNDGSFDKGTTSTSRRDTGYGACEIVYVENVSVNGDIY